MGIFEELKEKIVKECEDRNIITDLEEFYNALAVIEQIQKKLIEKVEKFKTEYGAGVSGNHYRVKKVGYNQALLDIKKELFGEGK